MCRLLSLPLLHNIIHSLGIDLRLTAANRSLHLMAQTTACSSHPMKVVWVTHRSYLSQVITAVDVRVNAFISPGQKLRTTISEMPSAELAS